MRTTLLLSPNVNGQIGVGSPVDRSGIETPAGTYLVARAEDLITIFLPGRHYWSGLGRQGYGSAHYEIYRVIYNRPMANTPLGIDGPDGHRPVMDDRIGAELVMSWPARRPKP